MQALHLSGHADAVVATDLSRRALGYAAFNAALDMSPSAADAALIKSAVEKLHGADIETYKDHRMAMCFAVLGLKVPGIRIKNPSCVSKTFPNFFEKLEQLRQ